MTPQNKVFVLGCLIIIFGWVILGYIVFDTYGSRIYMSADDPDNPIGYADLYITNEVKHVADSITENVYGEHNKTIAIMNYIDKNIDVNRTQYNPQPHIVLKEKFGSCGTFSILSVAMLTTQDINSHIIAMCGVKGHVAFESYYNERWHYYDPTFSAYWEKNGTVLSFDELKNGGARTATLHVGNITRYNLYNGTPIYLTPEIYETYYPSGVASQDCPLTSNCKPCEA